MKKFLIYTFILAVLTPLGACASKQTVEVEPYERSQRKSYESKIIYSVFAPFMYEDRFYAYYSLAKKINGPDKKGKYLVEFKNGPKAGEPLTSSNVITKVRKATADNLKKGMVVLVNHWDPREHNEDTRADMWRKGVVYNLDRLEEGFVMLEFPHDKNDFMATKETYRLDNLWLIINPPTRDPRIFLD